MFCTNCGKKLSDSVRFCSQCGTPVGTSASIPEQSAQFDRNEVEAEEVQLAHQERFTEESVSLQQVAADEEPVFVQQVAADEEPVSVQQTTDDDEPVSAQQETDDEEPVFVQQVVDDEEPSPVQLQSDAKKSTKKTGSKRPSRGVFRTILAVLVCMVVFVVSCSTMLVMGMRSFVDKDNLQNIIYKVAQNLDNIPAAGIYDNLNDDTTLMDAIVAFADENGAELNKKDIEKYVEDSKLVDTICEKLATYVTDIREDSSKAALDKKDLINLLDEDLELIYEVMGEDLSDRDIEDIAQTIEDSGILEFTNAKNLKKELSPVYYGVKYGLSLWSVVALWVVVFLLVILLFVINRWSMARTTGDAGITLTVSGAVTLLAFSLGTVLAGKLLNNLPFAGAISYLTPILIGSWVRNCLIVLAVGVVLILVSCLIKVISGLIQRHRDTKTPIA